MDPSQFFDGLGERIEWQRRAERRRIERFLDRISSRLTTVRDRERAFDRRFARRFNALDYLKTDELGLSRIVADLFDPHAAHGQGDIFLRRFLALLRESGRPGSLPVLDTCRIEVQIEPVIAAERRIDILAEIHDGDKTHALAIENKPYADDRKDQVADYLNHLGKVYGENFILVYLSPRGEGPSEWSVRAGQLEAYGRDRFAVLAYTRTEANRIADRFEPFRVPFSLTDWLETCRSGCEADRLRWFLGETARFCRRTFGDPTMTTDGESGAIRDFLLENPGQLDTAFAVYAAWPSIRDGICRQFLDRIRARIEGAEALKPFAHDLQVHCRYAGEPRYRNALWLTRRSWRPYDTEKDSDSKRRTAVRLQAEGPGPNGWGIGIWSPALDALPDLDRERRQKLQAALNGFFDSGRSWTEWPCWTALDRSCSDWNPLLQALHGECADNDGGKIADYFVDTFVELAVEAIPHIDGIER